MAAYSSLIRAPCLACVSKCRWLFAVTWVSPARRCLPPCPDVSQHSANWVPMVGCCWAPGVRLELLSWGGAAMMAQGSCLVSHAGLHAACGLDIPVLKGALWGWGRCSSDMLLRAFRMFLQLHDRLLLFFCIINKAGQDKMEHVVKQAYYLAMYVDKGRTPFVSSVFLNVHPV